ncbi:MAG: hypothetical protein Q8N14_04805 [Candidatus Omnitrophota bacterium]|nr:hypothetical protein [Candidatus Omnitrophota bacterium]
MKNKVIILVFSLMGIASLVFAQTPLQESATITKSNADEQTGYFIHKSGIFKIKSPEGYKQGMHSDKEIEFGDEVNHSFFIISFSDSSQEGNDSELLERFNDKTFLSSTMKGLEDGSGMTVTANRERKVNGMPAWEFTLKMDSNYGPFMGKNIVLYKNKREFLIQFGILKKDWDSKAEVIEESLATFEVL